MQIEKSESKFFKENSDTLLCTIFIVYNDFIKLTYPLLSLQQNFVTLKCWKIKLHHY